MPLTTSQRFVMDNSVSILINSCDAYEDVWNPFFHSFYENWPDCPYKIYLNTETKEYKSEFIQVTSLGVLQGKRNIEWGERLRDCLSRIESDYVVMLFDDFCLEGRVDQRKIEICVEKLKKYKTIDVFYLVNAFRELIDNSKKTFIEVPAGKDYRLNSAPGLWRRDSLIKYTDKKDNPWAWEYFGTIRIENLIHRHFLTLNGKPDIYPYNYKIGGAIHRGRWVESVIKPIDKKYDLNIDFSKRGFTDETQDKNSKLWDLKFVLTGTKMVGLKAFRYLQLKQFPARVFRRMKKLITDKIGS